MRKYLPIYLPALLISLLLPVSAHAATVKIVHVNTTKGIFFRTNEEMVDPEGCDSKVWYHIQEDSKYEKEALSVLLAAKMAKAKVEFDLDGCAGLYPRVVYINTSD